MHRDECDGESFSGVSSWPHIFKYILRPRLRTEATGWDDLRAGFANDLVVVTTAIDEWIVENNLTRLTAVYQ